MQKMEFAVGQKIRGYGLLNEFGEFDFIPEQTGIRQGETKLIKSTDEYTISETKKKVIIHVRIEKDHNNNLDLLKNYLTIMNKILLELRKYEI